MLFPLCPFRVWVVAPPSPVAGFALGRKVRFPVGGVAAPAPPAEVCSASRPSPAPGTIVGFLPTTLGLAVAWAGAARCRRPPRCGVRPASLVFRSIFP